MSRIITNSHVAATLRVAATVLDVQGWVRGDYSANILAPAGQGCCALGAIAVAAGLPATAWEEDPQDADAVLAHGVMRRAAIALAVSTGVLQPGEEPEEPDLVERVGVWNDTQDATSTVMRALRRAADDAGVAA